MQQSGINNGSFYLNDDTVMNDDDSDTSSFECTRGPTSVGVPVGPLSQAGKTPSPGNHMRTLSPTSPLKGKSFDFMTLPGTPTSSQLINGVHKRRTAHGFSTGSESLAGDVTARRKANILRYSVQCLSCQKIMWFYLSFPRAHIHTY